MTTDQAKVLLESDPDFVYAKRYDYSLTSLLERYPDGVPDRVIASVLLITEDDVRDNYDRIVKNLKTVMLPEE